MGLLSSTSFVSGQQSFTREFPHRAGPPLAMSRLVQCWTPNQNPTLLPTFVTRSTSWRNTPTSAWTTKQPANSAKFSSAKSRTPAGFSSILDTVGALANQRQKLRASFFLIAEYALDGDAGGSAIEAQILRRNAEISICRAAH